MTKIVAPCLIEGMSEDDYRAHPAISKSGLWTLYTHTPSHFANGIRKEKTHFTLGSAAHTAILEPDELENRFMRGPEDRRGNKWKDALNFAVMNGQELLTEGGYETALRVRDAVSQHTILEALRTGGTKNEQSIFWHDPETKAMCRARPDMFSGGLNIIADLKTTTDASPRAFARSVADYGYHVQQAFYENGWETVRDPIDGWVFIVIETDQPWEVAVYELDPATVAEGRAIARKALNSYAACLAADEWPGYGNAVRPLSLNRWDFRETPAPEPEVAA